MKAKLILLANVALFLFATLILASIQTSLWFQVFGYFPGPALWIPALVYVALHRSALEAALFAYLSGFALSSMTAMPEGILMIVCLAIALGTQVFKRRFYWESASYVMLTCGLASLFFNIFHCGLTFVLGEHPLHSPAVMDWLIEALLTPLVAPPLFPLFAWFDRITQRESTADMSTQAP